MITRTIVSTLLLGSYLHAQSQVATPVITIDQAIQEAISKNLDLIAQRLNVGVAETREITAKLRPNPVLTIAGQTLNLLGATYSPDTPLGPNQLNIHTDVPMERGHKREERMSLAKEQKSLAELGVREAMRQVIFGVQTAFVDIQQAKNNLTLAQENLRSLEGVVTINEARLRSGDLSQLELERSRVAAFLYRASVQQAQLQLDQAKTRLQLLMGRKLKTANFDVAGDLRRTDITDAEPDIAKKALLTRPDYLAGQQSQVRSQADLRLQLANGKVDYSVGAELTRQSAWGKSGNSIGLYFSMPLPVFNKNQGEILRARREITLAGAQKDALESSIATEVEQAFRQYSVSRQLLTLVETDMLGKAKNVRDITEYSYRRGEASLVEFLDAQRAFNDATQAYNDARASFARSLYLIETVSGATVSGN